MSRKGVMNVGDFEYLKKVYEQMYECEKCKSTFKGRQIELQKHDLGFSITPMHGMSLKLVQSPDKIISCSSTIELTEDFDYYTIHCPKCHKVHLFGMNEVTK